MTADTPGDGLAAALIQISAHAERISGLDTREAGHYQEIAARLRDLAAERRVRQHQDRRHRRHPRPPGRHHRRARRARRPGRRARPPASPNSPPTATKTTMTGGPATSRSRRHGGGNSPQQNARRRLTGSAPGSSRSTGPATASSPPPSRACWEQHPLCLYTLDWLSELWSVLYLDPGPQRRTLAAQSRMADPAAARSRRADGLRGHRLPAHRRHLAPASQPRSRTQERRTPPALTSSEEGSLRPMSPAESPAASHGRGRRLHAGSSRPYLRHTDVMATTKVTITLDDEVLTRVRTAVAEGQAANRNVSRLHQRGRVPARGPRRPGQKRSSASWAHRSPPRRWRGPAPGLPACAAEPGLMHARRPTSRAIDAERPPGAPPPRVTSSVTGQVAGRCPRSPMRRTMLAGHGTSGMRWRSPTRHGPRGRQPWPNRACPTGLPRPPEITWCDTETPPGRPTGSRSLRQPSGRPARPERLRCFRPAPRWLPGLVPLRHCSQARSPALLPASRHDLPATDSRHRAGDPAISRGRRRTRQLAKDHFRGDLAAAHAALIAHRRHWPVITSEDRAAGFREVGLQVELLP